jgi:hypothetical protein
LQLWIQSVHIEKHLKVVKDNIFEKNYRDYLAQINRLDLKALAHPLGIEIQKDEAIISFFKQPHIVSAKGIIGPSGKRPIYAVSVILFKYLLLCPDHESLESDWTSYRDFKDAAPLVNNFMNSVERPIARDFAGRLNELQKAAKCLSGQSPDIELSYDFSVCFDVLPKVPCLLLFNDKDDEFPAQCSVLFEKRADKFLDMECLAMAGMLLSEYLRKIQR